jgi:vacuolar-type H+-ATPase catalytic subunit A/Vma1
MVNYTCPTCYKEFNKKCNFIEHTEHKKKPCKVIAHNGSQNAQNCSQNAENQQLNLQNIQVSLDCKFCGQVFSKKFNLNRHINSYCKIKKSLDEVNDKTNKEYMMKLEDQSKKIEEQSKEMKELYKMIEDLKKQKTTNITINNTNNTDNSIKNDLTKINNNIKKLEEVIPDIDKNINNRLINIIANKEKEIDKLISKKEDDEIILTDNKIIENIIESKPINLIINNEIVVYRESDKYINATQLC